MSETEGPIRAVIETDSMLIEQGLIAILAESPEIEVVGRARDVGELLGLVEQWRPDAAIISLRTSVPTSDPMIMANMDAARHLRRKFPTLSIMVISDRGNGFALNLLKGGSSRMAYLIDDHTLGVEEILETLSDLRSGGTVLAPSIVDGLVTESRRASGLTAWSLTGEPRVGAEDSN